MFSLIKNFIAGVTAKEEVKILLIGPDGSGKSVGACECRRSRTS